MGEKENESENRDKENAIELTTDNLNNLNSGLAFADIGQEIKPKKKSPKKKTNQNDKEDIHNDIDFIKDNLSEIYTGIENEEQQEKPKKTKEIEDDIENDM